MTLPSFKLVNIQILRAAAALAVVWVHLSEGFSANELSQYFTKLGFVGVELFFMLSGFIMVYITDKKPQKPQEFLLNRVLRVVPLYYLFTILVILTVLILPNVFKSTTLSLSAIVQSLLFIPFEKSPHRIYPLYYLGWTLNYEMFFYFIYTLAMWLNFKFRNTICIVFFLLLIISSAFINGSDISSSPVYVLYYFWSRPIMLNFCLGMLVGMNFKGLHGLFERHSTLPKYILISGVAILLVMNYYLVLPWDGISPQNNLIIRAGLGTFLIFVGALGLDMVGRRIAPKFAEYIGDASYSIYLSHYFLVGFGLLVLRHVELLPPMHAAAGALLFVGTVISGMLVFRYVERPLIDVLAKLRFR